MPWSPQLRQRYLDRQPDGSYMVGEPLRRLVRLTRHNLARDPIPPLGEPGFDLIVCRNVLIYIDPPLGRQVIASLERALRPDGMLLLGAADALRRAADPPLPVQPAGLAAHAQAPPAPAARDRGLAVARAAAGGGAGRGRPGRS